jgi:4-diphosphocytidyl-2-C-methyl-D-erythritol kinase
LKLKAFAKLNLSLRVFEKRPDGFHNIESLMQSVSLHDIIDLQPSASGIQVRCNDPKVPQGEENLAYKAAELFLKKRNTGVSIHIEKYIPMAAGLAGGSADAAAVLVGLNSMTGDARLETGDLLKLGAEVGSDVPFCLMGGTCLVQGRGEIVDKQEPWPKTHFVLVTPDIHVSTKWAYDEFDQLHLNLSGQIKNDLEPAVVSRYEEITDIKEELIKLGCGEAQMSGSGPSVFGVVRHRAEADEVFKQIRKKYPRSFLAETIDKGVEIL